LLYQVDHKVKLLYGFCLISMIILDLEIGHAKGEGGEEKLSNAGAP